MKDIMRFGLWGLWVVVMPCAAQLPIELGVDHAAFAYDDQESMIEVYLSFGAASLQYANAEDGFEARVPASISLWRATDAALEGTPDDAVWLTEQDLVFAASDTSALSEGQFYVRQVRVPASPGEYEIRIQVIAPSGQQVEARRDVIVPEFSDADRTALSDITLATTIVRSDDREDPFYKNGLVILPNANQLYGEGMTKLFYYAEAYNVGMAVADSDEYTLLAYIAEANRPGPMPDLQKRTRRSVRNTDVLLGSFPLDGLVTGSYFLRLVVLNDANEAQVEQNRKFFVYNPSVQVEVVVQEATSFETSEYASIPEEEVSKGLKHIRVISTELEDRRLRRIEDLDERRRFLREFWLARDPNPGTPANEFRDEFYGLLQYANERYSIRGVEGWDTDRGQTLIKYGQPSAIEPHLYDRAFKPHELWNYNSIPGEGQALFVFADLDGFGLFEMVHSTVAGERKLANWQQEISNSY